MKNNRSSAWTHRPEAKRAGIESLWYLAAAALVFVLAFFVSGCDKMPEIKPVRVSSTADGVLEFEGEEHKASTCTTLDLLVDGAPASVEFCALLVGELVCPFVEVRYGNLVAGGTADIGPLAECANHIRPFSLGDKPSPELD